MKKQEPMNGAELFAPRQYADYELKDFHEKIQRYWDAPRRLENGTTAQKFRWNDMAVAFGALRKVSGSNSGFHYLAHPDRYDILANLWKQYENWRGKQDWVEGKKTEVLSETAQGIPF